jgi:hypothetical protein
MATVAARTRAGNRLRAMATLGDKHVQVSTGREFTYWCTFEVAGEIEITFVAVISVRWNALGQHEATLRFVPFGSPVKSVVRMNLLRRLDRTAFGEGVPPNTKWIGRYGSFL